MWRSVLCLGTATRTGSWRYRRPRSWRSLSLSKAFPMAARGRAEGPARVPAAPVPAPAAARPVAVVPVAAAVRRAVGKPLARRVAHPALGVEQLHAFEAGLADQGSVLLGRQHR